MPILRADMKRTFTKDEWKNIAGASIKPKRLKLESNDDNMFICPIPDCDSNAYKSQRGCRKHVSTKHGWHFYFDNKPSIEESFPDKLLQEKQDLRKRSMTWEMPAFSDKCKIAQNFTTWICSPGGGGKDLNQASQVCKKILKFAKFCCKDMDDSTELTKTILEYCVGSVNCIELFIKNLEETCKLGKPGIISYLQSLTHCLDFIRYMGVPPEKLSLFMATEVFLSRAKQCLRKKMRVEWNTLLSIEHLESLNCWATLKDLQKVIPKCLDQYKQVINNAKNNGCTSHDLSFATSFIVSLFFLKVKGTRPMTFQNLTLPMFRAACKSGVVDQTDFKTKEKYGFDSLMFSDEVLQLSRDYIYYIRPKFHPQCEYVLVCRNGKQLKNLGAIFGRIVYQAIGKYINPTRYRQIIETESVQFLSTQDQAVISLDQKHTSNVAKIHYQKQHSREIASKGAKCMQKLVEIGESSKVTDDEQNSEIDLDIEENLVTQTKEILAEPKESETPNVNENTKKKRQKKVAFSKEEDTFLSKGLKKYGVGKWSNILKDPEYKFHQSRKNSTLFMRAKAKNYV